jgi:hypothetical protein
MTLYDQTTAASYLTVSEKTLEGWRCRGGDGPPYIKVGGAVRYAKDDLDVWLESRRRRNTSDTGAAR